MRGVVFAGKDRKSSEKELPDLYSHVKILICMFGKGRKMTVREKWILETKKADFNGLAEQLGVSPLVVRCMVNRDLTDVDDMRRYLNGTLEDLYDPLRMKDVDRAVQILLAARGTEQVAIASDFDCDGIFSGYILWRAFRRIGLEAEIYTPDRVREGYGLNERIIDQAWEDGRKLLVTCDNGIAANSQVDYARAKGMKVIVTDHHEIQEEMPAADAVVDPKREDETYPFSGLCGAGVAYKLICALYDACGVPGQEKEELLEYVAVATVADVMELRDENRILVKAGLNRIGSTENLGLRALLDVQGLSGRKISAAHIGFVIGPCFNAAGRIATVKESFNLLMEEDPDAAGERAAHLKEINESRKAMTEEGAEKAFEILEKRRLSEDGSYGESGGLPPVLIVLLADTHESLVGIIAGRIKERYHHPVIVFTRTEEGLVKGSGRSIENYHMFRELMKCKDLMERFGGHKMAAGMTLREENLPELERRLNEQAVLREEDFRPLVRIDAAMPVGFVTERLIEELSCMEPFGVGNAKPLFAEQHFKVLNGRVLGREKNVLKLRVENSRGNRCDAMLFRGREEFEAFVRKEWGEGELARMYEGRENHLDVALTYYPQVNEYQGMRSVQIQIVSYCRVKR